MEDLKEYVEETPEGCEKRHQLDIYGIYGEMTEEAKKVKNLYFKSML